jgi:hypothetical protein
MTRIWAKIEKLIAPEEHVAATWGVVHEAVERALTASGVTPTVAGRSVRTRVGEPYKRRATWSLPSWESDSIEHCAASRGRENGWSCGGRGRRAAGVVRAVARGSVLGVSEALSPRGPGSFARATRPSLCYRRFSVSELRFAVVYLVGGLLGIVACSGESSRHGAPNGAGGESVSTGSTAQTSGGGFSGEDTVQPTGGGSPGQTGAPLPEGAVMEGISNRLGAFLLGLSEPDAKLREEVRALTTVEQVGALTERLLRDPRAREGLGSFVRWWLRLDGLLDIEKESAQLEGELRRPNDSRTCGPVQLRAGITRPDLPEPLLVGLHLRRPATRIPLRGSRRLG